MKTQKTLLEILVEELPKLGGWPVWAKFVFQDYDKQLRINGEGGPRLDQLATNHRKLAHYGSDYYHCHVTREQYEQAIPCACPTIGPTCAGCPDCPGASSTGLTSGDITNAAVSAAPKTSPSVLVMIDIYESGVDLRMSDAAAIAEHLIAQGYRRQDV